MATSILVVDDDSSFREAVSELLRARGFEIAGHAADRNDAVAAVQMLGPDAVLLDIQLAMSNGFDVLRELMRTDDGLPVLLTSSDSGAASQSLAIQRGAVGFVPKGELADADLRRYFAR
jgi:DNA-binding NarL/FixJ family response regulator